MSIVLAKDSNQGQEKAQVHQENHCEPKRIVHYEAYFAMRRAQVRLLSRNGVGLFAIHLGRRSLYREISCLTAEPQKHLMS